MKIFKHLTPYKYESDLQIRDIYSAAHLLWFRRHTRLHRNADKIHQIFSYFLHRNIIFWFLFHHKIYPRWKKACKHYDKMLKNIKIT